MLTQPLCCQPPPSGAGRKGTLRDTRSLKAENLGLRQRAQLQYDSTVGVRREGAELEGCNPNAPLDERSRQQQAACLRGGRDVGNLINLFNLVDF